MVEFSMEIETIWIDATLHWLVIVNTASQGAFSVHQEAASTVLSPETNTHFASGEVDDRMLMARHNLVQPDERTRRETKARGQPPYVQMRQIDCEFLTAFAMTFLTESFWHWGPCSLFEMDSERFKEMPRLEPGRLISRSVGTESEPDAQRDLQWISRHYSHHLDHDLDRLLNGILDKAE
jgi:hypothetical protein